MIAGDYESVKWAAAAGVSMAVGGLGYYAYQRLQVPGEPRKMPEIPPMPTWNDLFKKVDPKTVEDVNPVTGNTGLHMANGKQALGALLVHVTHPDFVNKKNLAGQTALHIHVTKDDVGAVMTLASYGADLDAVDSARNTALHIAASNGNLTMVRLLLLLGANPNYVNANNDSPRHIAANIVLPDKRHWPKEAPWASYLPNGPGGKKLNAEQRAEIVKSLDLMGASRCQSDKDGCQKLCAAGRAVGDAEEEEPPEDVGGVHPVDSVMTSIKEWRQEACLDEVKKKRRPQHLISLDGGGIRGLVIVQILMGLEKALGEPMWQFFDWAAGTSTGSFMACALAKGKSLRECQFLYLRFKDQLFEGRRPYNTANLEALLKREMGENTLLSDVPKPKLLITTTRADKHPMKLELFRNYQIPAFTQEENHKAGYLDPKRVKMWRAMRCSSAAPTYFASVDSTYLDGGLVANNPTMELIAEILNWNNAIQYKKTATEEKVDMGIVLSIGTGQTPEVTIENLDVDGSSTPAQVFTTMCNLGIMMVGQLCAAEGSPVDRSRSLAHSLGSPYFRFSAPMSRDMDLDSSDDVELVELMWDSEVYVRGMESELGLLADVLKSTRA